MTDKEDPTPLTPENVATSSDNVETDREAHIKALENEVQELRNQVQQQQRLIKGMTPSILAPLLLTLPSTQPLTNYTLPPQMNQPFPPQIIHPLPPQEFYPYPQLGIQSPLGLGQPGTYKPPGNVSLKQSVRRSGQKNPWCRKCKSAHSGTCTAQTMKCIRCGQFGHEGKDCKFPRVVCWNCQSEGHEKRKCPLEKKVDYGSSMVVVGESSSTVERKRKSDDVTDRDSSGTGIETQKH